MKQLTAENYVQFNATYSLVKVNSEAEKVLWSEIIFRYYLYERHQCHLSTENHSLMSVTEINLINYT